MDKRAGPATDIVADFEKPLPLPSSEYDVVYSSYLIEHISWRNVKQFIREVYRILVDGGQVQIITANFLEQCRVVANSKEWEENFSTMIFGDLDYPENSHKCGFSPDYAIKLFREAGFSDVEVKEHPNCKTDMLIFARKHNPEQKEMSEEYDRRYFEDGKTGYHMYRDFPVHYRMLDVILQRKPESVLDVGGARGYIVKKLNDCGIRAVCMDVSKHCYHTRATDSFVLHDAIKTPWPFKDKEFDLAISFSFMEHLKEEDVDKVIKEMARVSKRSIHTITPEKTPQDIDVTHKTFRPFEWWDGRFKKVAPKYKAEILTAKEEDYGPITVPPPDGLVKLNLGSFSDMFHYGWINTDIQNLSDFAKVNGYNFRQMDVLQPFPYQDNSVDIVYASHLLEHFNKDEGKRFLKEVYRVLKPSGIFRLSFPDTKLITKSYLDGNIMEFRYVNIGVENAESDTEAFFHLLLAGHATVYDFNSAKKILSSSGFVNIDKSKFNKSSSDVIRKQAIDMYPTLSCFVEAKPDKKNGSLPLALREKDVPKNLGVPKSDKLKIGIISTPFLRTPPDNYGGTEMVVCDLAEALAEMGHDVTVFAANGSKVRGCKVVEFGEPKMKVQVDWVQAERDAYNVYKYMLKEFDIIHGHNWLGFEYAAKAANPNLKVCHTHHGGINVEWWRRSQPPFKLNLIAISDFMKTYYETQGFSAKFVYNGVNLDKYPKQNKKGDRLLFVGRIDEFKQPHVAIEIAKKLDMGLDIVGGTFIQKPSYLETIKNQCDGKQIIFHPDAPHSTKIRLMQNAKALLFPSRMGEPFGLVAVEAMACFPFNTKVITPPIIRAQKRLFTGLLYDITTESGKRILATGEHPILTPFGWTPIKHLKEDDVICSNRCSTDEENMDARRIGEIYETIPHSFQGEAREGIWPELAFPQNEGISNGVGKKSLNDYSHEGFFRAFTRTDRIPCGNHRWRGNIDYEEAYTPPTKKVLLYSTSPDIKFFNGNHELAQEPLDRTEYISKGAFQQKRAVSVLHEGFRYATLAEDARALFDNKKNTLPRPSILDRKTTLARYEAIRNVGHRFGTTEGNKMVEFETITQVRTRATRNIEVYNFTTLRNFYYADGIIVHNCGTPVITSNDGAIDEVVTKGGIVCKVFEKTVLPGKGVMLNETKNVVDLMVDAVKKLKRQPITPTVCRTNAERFSRENMVRGYLECYKQVIAGNSW